MKKPKLFLASLAFVLSFFAFAVVSTGDVSAATRTWTGGGADNNFSNAENWDGDAPTNGDDIVLPVPTILDGCEEGDDVTLNNDLDASTVALIGISTTGMPPEGCWGRVYIAGNDLHISGDIVSSEVQLYITADTHIEDDITIERVHFEGSVDAGSYSVTTDFVSGNAGISGSGTLIIGFSDPIAGGAGGGCGDGLSQSWPISGDSSGFTGDIIVNGYAQLAIARSSSSLGRNASSITVDDDAFLMFRLDYNQNASFNTPITFNGGELSVFQVVSGETCQPNSSRRTQTIESSVNVTTPIEVSLTNADLHFSGNVTNENNLQLKDGQTGSISFADGTSVESEQQVININDDEDCWYVSYVHNANTKVIVSVDCAQDEFSPGHNAEDPIAVRGTLAGTGKVGHVLVLEGGVVAPGLSPGILTMSSIEWEEGGIYEFEMAGTDAGEYDRIVAEEGVTIDNATLLISLIEDFSPSAGDEFMIIQNDSSDPVDGTFADLPEGATFTQDGYVFEITYEGGDGNDVVLTVRNVPGAPDTGFAMLVSANPIITLLVTTLGAVGIVLIARRYKQITA